MEFRVGKRLFLQSKESKNLSRRTIEYYNMWLTDFCIRLVDKEVGAIEEEVLEDTYGVLLYQEQAMKIVQVMANYDLGEADMFRRAIGKKHPEEMAVLIPKFIKDSGEDEEVMKKIAEWLMKRLIA